jgi:hypothetical protein
VGARGSFRSARDTAPTVLWLLGVRAPVEWTGAPVVQAFRQMPAE